MKEREAELEKSTDDKQQLKNQIHNLKAGLHNLQTTHTLQVRITTDKHIYSHLVFMFMWF